MKIVRNHSENHRETGIRRPVPGFVRFVALIFWIIVATHLKAQEFPFNSGFGYDPDSMRFGEFPVDLDKFFTGAYPADPSPLPIRSVLPEEWAEIATVSLDSIAMIGISDPGLPDSVALLQAVTRATGLASLARSCKITMVNDRFVRANPGEIMNRYEEVYCLSAISYPDPERLQTVKNIKLPSGEIIVVVLVPSDQTGPRRETTGCLYNQDIDTKTGKKLISRLSFINLSPGISKPEVQPDTVIFYQLNKRFFGVKNLCAQLNPPMAGNDYFYEQKEASEQTAGPARDGSACKSGLWVALVNEILDRLSLFLKKNDVESKRVSDAYNGTSSEINREKTGKNLRFHITKILVSNNILTAELTITHEK